MTQDIRHYMNILNEDVVPLQRPVTDMRSEVERYNDNLIKQKAQMNPKKHLDIIKFYLNQDNYSSTENLIRHFRTEWYASFSEVNKEAFIQYSLMLDNSEFEKLSEEFEQKYGFDIIKDMINTTAKKVGLKQ